MSRPSVRVATVVLFLALAGCQPVREQPQKLDFDKLQTLANKACLCDRSSGAKQNCWQDYKRQSAGHQASEGDTACTPLSEKLECFNDGGESRCITLGYPVSKGKTLCSADEANAFEALLDQYYKEDPESETAADQAYADVLSGKRPAKSASGCS